MITKYFNIDIRPGNVPVRIHASQYDVGYEVCFTIYNGDSVMQIPSNATAVIEGTKPDKKGFSYSAQIQSASIVSFKTTKNMTAVPGETICELRLKQGANDIGTANFILDVERAGLADDVDVSETELPGQINAAQEAAKDAEAWAIGTKNGIEVPSSENQYHNNSKWYAQLAGEYYSRAINSANTASTAASTAEQSANEARTYSRQAAASVAQGVGVRFYVNSDHLYLVKTVDGVEQAPEDLGEVGGGMADYVFETAAEMNAAISSGTVPDGATCYVEEDIVSADSAEY